MNKKNMLSKAEMKGILGGQTEFGKCSANCSADQYACCIGSSGPGTQPACACVDNKVLDGSQCESGGPGSQSCSVN